MRRWQRTPNCSTKPNAPNSTRCSTALRNVAQSDDADAIEAATKTLAEGTDEFAARRMNKGIRRALAGRKLDEI